jgi:hypothetical protein
MLTRKQTRELDRVVIRLEDLRENYTRETDKAGNPLSDSVLSFNESIRKRIDRIIEAIDAVMDEDGE